ncbi:sensor domain-containing diguanylate cyclase [Marinobacterium litorale]|uniref:sensor domain-containing diguanylate cyclase n=1 Tax=Marinobacterium litorale TaxID=404770 RepID=UPI0012EC7196|nr:EAL domain-containing protein [Marinobacterium litorale]
MTTTRTDGYVAPEAEVSAEGLSQILRLQQEIFRQVSENENYRDILDSVCHMAEALLPNALATIMLLDPLKDHMDVCSAPTVPENGKRALAGLKPGPESGSCGNAVYLNEPVFVRDTFTDRRWRGLRSLARDFNLCACWSMPIRDLDGRALGSFALSSFEHREPSAFHKLLLEVGASLIGMLLRHQSQAEALDAKQRRLELLATALHNSAEGMIITDANNRILEVNPAFERITGYEGWQVRGMRPSVFRSGAHGAEFYRNMWVSLLADGHWSGEVINRRRDGSLLTQWLTINLVRDETGRVVNHVAVFTDLTELKAEREQLLRAREYDALTGLPNAASLRLLVGQETQPQSLLLLNVNNFSFINSAYGVKVGDNLLRVVANELTRIDSGCTVFRIDADQFALYVRLLEPLEPIVARIQRHFQSRVLRVDELSFHLTFNYGGATGTQDLLRHAMMALKAARSMGKNRAHIFDPDVDESRQQHRLDYVQWNTWLHQALEDGGLQPWYQGIRDNNTGQINKYEVLARVEHDGRVYAPGAFISAARLAGLLPALTRQMIRGSFACMARNTAQFAINISDEDLDLGYLGRFLDRMALQYGVDPGRVILEIHEGVSSGAARSSIAQLQDLKRRGYQLAIDDFGAEYSNFERIMELDVDYIKIDARYIKDIDTNPRSYEITRAIVFFARNAGIATVAEFIHSPEVQAVVEELGISYSQGFLFSEPAARPAFV